jgi:hypothetical protein
MPSKRRIESNRRNAQRSTGPKTERGKCHASTNALFYGIHSAARLLPLEDKAEYERLVAEVLADLKPIGPIENGLVWQIIHDIRRLERLEYAENAQLTAEIQTRALHRSCERQIRAIHELELKESYSYEANGRLVDSLIADVYANAPKVAPSQDDYDSTLAAGVGNPEIVQLWTMRDRLRETISRRIFRNRVALDALQRNRAVPAMQVGLIESSSSESTNPKEENEQKSKNEAKKANENNEP